MQEVFIDIQDSLVLLAAFIRRPTQDRFQLALQDAENLPGLIETYWNQYQAKQTSYQLSISPLGDPEFMLLI